MCALALLCALGAGFSLGRQTPGWKEDSAREYAPSVGDVYLYGSHYIGGRFFFAFFGSAWGSALLALAALLLAYLFWPHNNGFEDLRHARRAGWLLLLFEPSAWALLLAAGAGYTWAVLTDKGPVGPLK